MYVENIYYMGYNGLDTNDAAVYSRIKLYCYLLIIHADVEANIWI
nr:hypothetical protein [Sedimentibacter sp.]